MKFTAKYGLFVLALGILGQWYVPIGMIWKMERLLYAGTAIKMKLAPVDPIDPLRGRYLQLSFAETTYTIDSANYELSGMELYVQFKTDTAGYAIIDGVSVAEPDNGLYVKAQVSGLSTTMSNTTLRLSYAFDRFYIDESKALEAEKRVAQLLSDTNQPVYAELYIKNGNAAIADLFVDGLPLSEWLEKE
jgi:uncharacterized membrane-anchored protein